MSDSPQSTGDSGATPKKRTGFTIFLYVLLALVIVGCLWALKLMKQVESNPTVREAVATYENLIKDMENLTQAQIEQQAEHISAVDLARSPETVKGRYVVVDGQIQGEESTMVDQNMSIPNMVVENLKTDTKGYVLDDGTVLVDISGVPGEQLKGGDYVRGYGAVLVVSINDVFDFPIVGPDLKKEFSNGIEENAKVVFLISKGVRKITAEEMAPPVSGSPVGMDGAAPADGTAPPADGTAPPADGTTPPADGTAPPADGTTPPADGTTPPGEGTPPPPGDGTAPPSGETPPAAPPAAPPAGGGH
jgi:hypothetical protein